MRYCLVLLIVLTMLAAIPSAFGATTFYVKWDAPAGGNGLSWATAFRTVTEAMAAVTPQYTSGPGYYGDEVHVAGSTTGDIAVYVGHVTMKAGCKLLGGYSGVGDTRDWKTYHTYLDGTGTNDCVVDFTAGCFGNTVVDGFTIQNGTGRLGTRIYPVNQTAVLGGGIYCVGHVCPIITNNAIINNQASSGQYWSYGGGVYFSSDSPPTFENNVVMYNYASQGGGICVDSWGSGYIRNNRIYGNNASYGGGISCSYDASPIVAGNVISGNQAVNGAAIYAVEIQYPYYPVYATFTNNTITNNHGYPNDPKAGIYIDSNATVKFYNNIFSSNQGSFYRKDFTSNITFQHNDLFGNLPSDYYNFTPDASNISAAPELTTDYHLREGSPCIDTGLNSVVGALTIDFDGDPRIINGIVDIGADEWTDGDDCAVMHVSQTGNDAWSGLSWETAKKTIQAAINDPLLACEVWVKAGTYSESITLRDGVGVYGGFAGTELTRTARNWAVNPTIIDGNAYAKPVVSIVSCPLETTTIDGFTIRGGSGYDSGECGSQVKGGGIYCVNSKPLIAHNIITDNTGTMLAYGGGIYCLNSAARIFSNALKANAAATGCGIYSANEGTSTDAPLILNNTFTDNCRPPNSYGTGGAIYCSNAPNTRIINNILANNAYGILAFGTQPTEHHHNCLYQNGTGSGELPSGTGDLTGIDPVLVVDRIHIQPNSPCTNVGSDTLIAVDDQDIDKQSRIDGAHVDIGADESYGCAWLDVTTTGPVEIALNSTAVVTARVYDPVAAAYVDNLRVDFTVTNGQLLSITNGEGQAGTVTSTTTGYGQTDYNGSIQVTVRGTALGYLGVTASISGCFGTLTDRKPIGVYDPADVASTEWPMFMHDREHTGMSGVNDAVGDTLNDGVPNWSFTLPSYWDSSYWTWALDSSPVYAGGKVVVGVTPSATTGDVYAFDPDANGGSQGIVLWRATLSPIPPSPAMGPVLSTPCISGDKVYVASLNGYLYCLQLSDGSQVWSAPVFVPDESDASRQVFGSPVVYEGRVYVGNSANMMYAFDAVTGDPIENWPVVLTAYPYGPCRTTSPAVTVTTNLRTFLLVGSEYGRVYRIDLDSSTPTVASANLWSSTDSSPSVKSGYIYIGSTTLDQNVHKLSVDPLALVASSHVYAEVRTTPVLFDTNLWVGCDTGHTFFRLHTAGLRYLSSFDSDPTDYFVGSGALVRTDEQEGIVYTGCDNDKFYCRDAMALSKAEATYDAGSYYNMFRASPAIGYITDGSGNRDRWVFIRDTGNGYSANGRIFAFKTDR